MKLSHRDGITRRLSGAGFTFVELLVATSISILLAVGAMMFANSTVLSISAITAQSTINQQAGNAIEFLQINARLATSISNDTAGNILTLGFDDNFAVDSDADGKPYNDRDHFARFQFLGVNSTNSAACATNRLVYFPNVNSTNKRVLVSAGLRNLPGYKIFNVTNNNTVIIRFGMVDPQAADRYQAIEIQGTAVSLNRPASTNLISILP